MNIQQSLPRLATERKKVTSTDMNTTTITPTKIQNPIEHSIEQITQRFVTIQCHDTLLTVSTLEELTAIYGEVLTIDMQRATITFWRKKEGTVK